MKRTTLAILVLLCAGPALAGDRLLLSAGWSLLRNADAYYRATYGQSVSLAEFAAAGRIYRNFYIMAGYGSVTKRAVVPDLETEAVSRQGFLWAGLGYIRDVWGPLKAKIEAGPADLIYKEEGLGLTASGSQMGFQAQAGLLAMAGFVFAGIDIGYSSASANVGDLKIKLGGARITMSAGLRL
jgi:hypothetical protein